MVRLGNVVFVFPRRRCTTMFTYDCQHTSTPPHLVLLQYSTLPVILTSKVNPLVTHPQCSLLLPFIHSQGLASHGPLSNPKDQAFSRRQCAINASVRHRYAQDRNILALGEQLKGAKPQRWRCTLASLVGQSTLRYLRTRTHCLFRKTRGFEEWDTERVKVYMGVGFIHGESISLLRTRILQRRMPPYKSAAPFLRTSIQSKRKRQYTSAMEPGRPPQTASRTISPPHPSS